MQRIATYDSGGSATKIVDSFCAAIDLNHALALSAPQCVGQFGDVQGEADNFALLSWAHTFANEAVLTSSLMYHFERADYDEGAGDYPTITTYHHSSPTLSELESPTGGLITAWLQDTLGIWSATLERAG
jgi:hypothetical protein